MDFESLKEQFVERFNTYKTQAQDTEIYIRLKERYDTLTPSVQRVIKVGSVVLVVYFFYSIPASFVSSANSNLERFSDNRQLTRELIRAGRIEKTVELPQNLQGNLSDKIEAILTEEKVLPEQKMALTPKENIASKNLVPKSIKQSGVKLILKQLTLPQVIHIGEALNQIESSRLINIAIQADAQDPHYFTADYEVASFEVPRDPEPLEAPKKKSKFGSKKKRGKK